MRELSLVREPQPIATVWLTVVEPDGSLVNREVVFGEVYAMDAWVMPPTPNRCRLFLRAQGPDRPLIVAETAESLRARLGWRNIED